MLSILMEVPRSWLDSAKSGQIKKWQADGKEADAKADAEGGQECKEKKG